MSRLQTLLAALVGIGFVAAGIAIGLDSQPSQSEGVTAGLVLIALLAAAIGCWKIRGQLDATTPTAAVPWADSTFATPAPERSDREPPLSSDELAGVIERAGDAARTSGSIDEGMAIVRPPLREALSGALVQGGDSREAVESAIDDGSWTDDRLAASVLSASVEPPPRPFRDRLRTWLFPERTVRRRTGHAMGCVAAVADEALPAVPGQHAPRNVPVLQPRLETLQRGAGGELQRAVNPDAVRRGPRPRRSVFGVADRSGANAADGTTGAARSAEREDERNPNGRTDNETPNGRTDNETPNGRTDDETPNGTTGVNTATDSEDVDE